MPERMPPDDDPIIRSLREAGIRPLRPPGEKRALPVRRSALILIAVLLVVVALVPFIAGRLADWLWYREIGFERVFLTKIIAQWLLGVPTAVVAFGVLYASARIALREAAPRVRASASQARGGAELREV